MPFASSPPSAWVDLAVPAGAAVRPSRIEYDPSCYGALVVAEEHHFWFRARSRLIATLAGQVVRPLNPGYRVLEVGCGAGYVLRALRDACSEGTVIGMDLFEDGLRHARARLPETALVRGDVLHPPFSQRFELVGLFDVLEHMEDDLRVLGSARDLLAEDGVLMLTVPAGAGLWSYADVVAKHARRYEAADLDAKLRLVGLDVEYLSPFMASLYPVLWVGRRVASFRDRRAAGDPDRGRELFDDELRVNPVAGAAFGWVLEQELRWLRRRRRLPLGASLVAIARRGGSVPLVVPEPGVVG
jgi:SAM-dependent methyltransferase